MPSSPPDSPPPLISLPSTPTGSLSPLPGPASMPYENFDLPSPRVLLLSDPWTSPAGTLESLSLQMEDDSTRMSTQVCSISILRFRALFCRAILRLVVPTSQIHTSASNCGWVSCYISTQVRLFEQHIHEGDLWCTSTAYKPTTPCTRQLHRRIGALLSSSANLPPFPALSHSCPLNCGGCTFALREG